MKNFKKSLLTLTKGLKSSTEKKNFGQNLEKSLLKNKHVRNFAPLNEPLNIFLTNFYFNPEVAHKYRLYGVKIRNIRVIEYLTLGHLSKGPNFLYRWKLFGLL